MAQIGGVGYAVIGLYKISDNSLVDSLSLTTHEEEGIRFDFPPEKDCENHKLDNGGLKSFEQGARILIEIDFFFSDWTTVTSGTNGWSCQLFLKHLHNAPLNDRYIKVTLHSDKASQIYKVKTLKGWEGYQEAIPGRWNGYRGTLSFIGIERLTSGIDIIE